MSTLSPMNPISTPHAALSFPPPGAGVPAHYRGIWRRTLLETSAGRDTATVVYWLQGTSWHADIRIPAGRPDFAGIAGLAACPAAHRAWLATQQGFAGVTSVRRDAYGELCSWRRVVDYQPPQDQPDEGWMRFEPDCLIETGAHAGYLEHWLPVPDTTARIAVLRAVDGAAGTDVPAEMLFLAGPYAMHLRWPRRAPAAAGPWLDLEIAFAVRQAAGLDIVHSTLPWMEGTTRPLRVLAHDGRFAELDCDGRARTWRILESTGADVWDVEGT